jgi:hypothetical protein
LPKLVNLQLQNNATKVDGLYALGDSPLLPHLRTLHCTIEAAAPTPAWTRFFARGHALERLDLHGSILSRDAIQPMLQTPPPRLIALDLRNTPLHDGDIHAFAESPLAAQLGELCLHLYTISDAGWKHLNRSALVDSVVLLDTNGQATRLLRKRYGTRVI